MRAEKSEHLERADAEALIESATRLQMSQRDPHVLRVPNDGRNQAERERSQEKIEAAPFEFTPVPGNEREHQNNGNQLKGVGVFAEKTQPDQQPGRDPGPGRFRSFERDPER